MLEELLSQLEEKILKLQEKAVKEQENIARAENLNNSLDNLLSQFGIEEKEEVSHETLEINPIG